MFTCETEIDQQDWVKHFSNVMKAEMSPQEYTSKNSNYLINRRNKLQK